LTAGRTGPAPATRGSRTRTASGRGSAIYKMHEIDRESVQVWLAGLSATAKSHRTIVQTVATLRVMLATALEWARPTTNPAACLKLPDRPGGEPGPSSVSLLPINLGP